MLVKKINLLFFVIVSAFSLCSCGKSVNKENEIATFSTQVNDFTNIIKTADEQINNLDVTDINTPNELLEILDNLSIEFDKFSKVSVPNKYNSIETLADDANEYMTQSVSYYHDAFSNGDFDSQYWDAAYYKYNCAMMRVKYIGYILTGKIPEDENIEVNIQYNNDSKLLEKILFDEENSETIPKEE